MLQLKNSTPFKAAIAIFPDEQGVDSLYITIKATFAIGKSVTAAGQQLPLWMADEFWGEAAKSSLKYASEIHLVKPSTDVIVVGSAYAPEGKPTPSVDVSVQVGSRNKVIRVFGDRKWYLYESNLRISPPTPFVNMPLVYERAYGGVHESDGKTTFDQRNPVGIGFKGGRGQAEMDKQPLPNLEDPSRLISKPEDQPAPVCFGFVAPSWEPRKSFAGTYDEKWQKQRAPYLPEDFQSKYFNAAHPDLVIPGYLRGGEPVTIKNMSPAGTLRFNLPVCKFDISVRIEERTETPAMNLETVLIEPDESRLSMIWRCFVECDKKVLGVRQVDLALKGSGLEQDAA